MNTARTIVCVTTATLFLCGCHDLGTDQPTDAPDEASWGPWVEVLPACLEILTPDAPVQLAPATSIRDIAFDGEHLWTSTDGAGAREVHVNVFDCGMSAKHPLQEFTATARGALELTATPSGIVAVEMNRQGEAAFYGIDGDGLELRPGVKMPVPEGNASIMTRPDGRVIAAVPLPTGDFELRTILDDGTAGEVLYTHEGGGGLLPRGDCGLSLIGEDVRFQWRDFVADESHAIRVSPDGVLKEETTSPVGWVCRRGTDSGDVKLHMGEHAWVALEDQDGRSWDSIGQISTTLRPSLATRRDRVYFAPDNSSTIVVLNDAMEELGRVTLEPPRRIRAIEPVGDDHVAVLARDGDSSIWVQIVDVRL